MTSILGIAGAITALFSSFALALFVTERHDRRLLDPPLTRGASALPPTHVRVVRNDE